MAALLDARDEADALAYVRAVQGAEIVAYVDHVRAEEAAELARQEAARRNLESRRPNPSSGGTVSGDCTNPIVPESVARRESGCRWDAQSPPSFCGGRGCTGFFQLDNGHFYAVSPWNNNVPGACYGLDPSTREGQIECASRLGPGAWG